MIIYYMDEEAYNYLTEWSERHKISTRFCSEFNKKSKVILKDYNKQIGMNITFYAERVKETYKFSLLDDDGIFAKGRLTAYHEENKDFMLGFDIKRKIDKEQQNIVFHTVKLYATAFLTANCFMWYGNLADEKEYIATGRNMENGNKVITFRKFNDTLYAVPIGHHRSPEGVFAVRGHFRKYQNGKVIWIDSYLKGQD